MAQITYDNKVNLNTNADIPRINKVTDEDLNEIKNVVNANAVLNSLSEIGLSEFTTLDAIVTAVPNGKTLRLYLSDDNASTLYGTSGGTGNLPTNIAGILTVQKNSENNWVYISYNTNLSVDENENAGLFYTTKFTGYRVWKSVLFKSEVQDGKPIPTGRKIGGKDEYFVEKQITTPAVNNNFSTVFAFTQDVTVHEMSNMVFPSGFDGDQYPNNIAFDSLFRHGTGVIARVTSENSWWANRTGIIRMYFTYN